MAVKLLLIGAFLFALFSTIHYISGAIAILNKQKNRKANGLLVVIGWTIFYAISIITNN
tara:strand:+ start:330 stop:506 length:177 start_codon:yes stop_codon:yes gene_type:complete